MKKICNEIMKITPNVDVGLDYSGIALLWFALENVEKGARNYSVMDYAEYLYRFYADNPVARDNHYHKMINNLFHYCPLDFCEYAKTCLLTASKSLSFIGISYDGFYIDLPFEDKEFQRGLPVLRTLIKSISVKHLGKAFKEYNSAIHQEETSAEKLYMMNSRVFNRVIERRNYCFICEERRLSELAVVPIADEKTVFSPNNYLLMCKKHCHAFLSKKLVIRKNGYPYIDGIRQMEHIAIEELKLIRQNLPTE